jgi:hypothetical protein
MFASTWVGSPPFHFQFTKRVRGFVSKTRQRDRWPHVDMHEARGQGREITGW